MVVLATLEGTAAVEIATRELTVCSSCLQYLKSGCGDCSSCGHLKNCKYQEHDEKASHFVLYFLIVVILQSLLCMRVVLLLYCIAFSNKYVNSFVLCNYNV